jgi:uncharacterized membrane protein
MNIFDEFPSLHPLIVHFPIVLLAVAPIFQLWALLSNKSDILLVAAFLVAAGCFAGFIASNIFHTEPFDVTSSVKAIFIKHEEYAELAFWTSLAATLIKIVAAFARRARRLSLEWAALIVMVVAMVLVSMAGHLGAELTHIHEVKAE